MRQISQVNAVDYFYLGFRARILKQVKLGVLAHFYIKILKGLKVTIFRENNRYIKNSVLDICFKSL